MTERKTLAWIIVVLVLAMLLWPLAFVLWIFGGVVGSYGDHHFRAFFCYLLMWAVPGLLLRIRRRQPVMAILGLAYAPLAGVLYMWLTDALLHSPYRPAGYMGLNSAIALYFLPLFLLNLVQIWRCGANSEGNETDWNTR